MIRVFLAFMLGVAGGAYVQGIRLDAERAKFASFAATVKAQGVAAEKLANAKIVADRKMKENSDHEYATTIARLDADVKRMRNNRASSRIVPAAPASSRSPDLACFDRADLERTLQRLDAGISGLIAEGDTDAVGLNVAKEWAAATRP